MKKKFESSEKMIEYLWLVINEAKRMVEDKEDEFTPSEKKGWATVLGNTIAILNKVLASQKGEKKIDKRKIAHIISGLPKKYRKYVKIVERRSRLKL